MNTNYVYRSNVRAYDYLTSQGYQLVPDFKVVYRQCGCVLFRVPVYRVLGTGLTGSAFHRLLKDNNLLLSVQDVALTRLDSL